MSNLRRLTWEEAEDFTSYLVRTGYAVQIEMSKTYDSLIYLMQIKDMLGELLAESSASYDIDISTLVMRCLDDYITTDDGKLMLALWAQ